jgi:hypothetical protein
VWCPAALARVIAEAIVTGVACHCEHGHAAPAGHPGPGAAVNGADSQDTIRRLIAEAAYQRGADVSAIARVVGMTADKVRDVLRSADIGALT